MFCSKCGKQLLDGSVFCDKCGQKVKTNMSNSVTEEVKEVNAENVISTILDNNMSQPQTQINTSAKKRPIVPIAIVTAIVATLCAVLCLIFIGNKFAEINEDTYTKTGSLVLVYDSTEDITRAVYNNVLLDDHFQGEACTFLESSFDGNIYAVTVKDELYVVNEKGIQFVDNCLPDPKLVSSTAFSLSYDGKGLVYVDCYKNVIIYDCIQKEKTIIADYTMNGTEVTDLNISPDGKSAAYSTYLGNEYVMYLYVDGKNKIVSKNIRPIAISNNGKSCFAYDDNRNLYYIKNGEMQNISSSFAYYYDNAIILNNKNDEIIFNEADNGVLSSFYFSANSGKTEIFNSSEGLRYEGLYPNNTIIRGVQEEASMQYPKRIIPSNSLTDGAVYLQEYDAATGKGNMITISKNGEAIKTPSTYSEVFSDFYGFSPIYGKYYLSNGILIYNYVIYKNNEKTDMRELISGIEDYTICNNGHNIYYTRNGEDTDSYRLYYSDIYGKNEIIICENVVNDAKLLDDQYFLFTDTDNNVYISDNGGEKKVVSGEFNLYCSYITSYGFVRFMRTMVYSAGRFSDTNIYILKPDGSSELIHSNLIQFYFSNI